MQIFSTFRTLLAAVSLLGALVANPATAQDYGAMIAEQLARGNAMMAHAQQRVNGMVQQRMQDPAVQRAWHQYVANSGGRPQMDYPSFTYHYIYTNGFSAAGMAHMRATENGNRQREHGAWQGVRQAEAQRGAAMQANRDAYFANQNEAGLGLQGRSTYAAPDGRPLQLPHTWQRNSTQQWNGQTYHVDTAGQYHVLAGNGWWYPVNATR